jgi:hypothetical protein
MLDDWLKARLGDDARLMGVRVRALFGSLGDPGMENFLDLFTSGVFPGGVRPLDYWEAVFSQLARVQYSGVTAINVFRAMLGPGNLTGAQLRTFWSTSLGRTGGSEVLARSIETLIGPGGLTGGQISTLIGHLLDGAHRIKFDKDQVLQALTNLRVKLSPTQTQTCCTFFQTNLPAIHQTDKMFSGVCRRIRASTMAAVDITALFAGHGTLTAAHTAQLLLECQFDYPAEFIHTALPVGLVRPGGVANTGGDVLAYAIGRGTVPHVIEVLDEGRDAAMPVDAMARALCHLRLMAAGDRVKRVATFIREAYAARTSKGRAHPWAEIMDLVGAFVTDNRHTNGPGTVGHPAAINVGRCYCTGERVGYFLKAHTYCFLDFTIVGRSRDDITFFPAGTDAAAMDLAVRAAFAAIGGGDVDNAVAADQMVIANYAGYETGLIADRAHHNCAALIHFMPFTLNREDYWHKNLLAAVGRLF